MGRIPTRQNKNRGITAVSLTITITSIYRAIKKLTDSQLSLAHGKNCQIGKSLHLKQLHYVSLDRHYHQPAYFMPTAEEAMFSLWPVVPMFGPTSAFFWLRTSMTERISKKFGGGNLLSSTDELVTIWANIVSGRREQVCQKIRIDVKPVLPRSERST